jgi:hypothetical protein
VKVLCSEGVANHTGPESCVLHREMQGEALMWGLLFGGNGLTQLGKPNRATAAGLIF